MHASSAPPCGSHTQPGPAWSCVLDVTQCRARRKADGRRCQRRTFRHPYCLQHLRQHAGLDIRRSTIPGAGCGLFTVWPRSAGDVLIPYTGHSLSTTHPDAERRSAYKMKGPQNTVVDAACLRGAGAYANAATRGRPKNADWDIQRITGADRFHPIAGDPRQHLAVPAALRRTGRLSTAHGGRFRHWRRIPATLVADFTDAPAQPWLVTTSPMNAGDEILLNYGGHTSHIFENVHATVPRPC